jgi:protein-L-isoaspartate(D-aspartate) O-methyltransferase
MMARVPRSTPEELVATLRRAGIHDERLLAVFRQALRETFVPPESRHRAYDDVPLPIAQNQVTTQPSLLALMVQALELRGDERVLEIGTGLGFEASVLALMCREVISIEWFAELGEQARANLHAAGITNVTVVVGDGSLGWPERAPYDGIIVAAAAPVIAEALVAQLAEAGRLVQPLGTGGNERVTAFVKRADQLLERAILTDASFVPLRGRGT